MIVVSNLIIFWELRWVRVIEVCFNRKLLERMESLLLKVDGVEGVLCCREEVLMMLLCNNEVIWIIFVMLVNCFWVGKIIGWLFFFFNNLLNWEGRGLGFGVVGVLVLGILNGEVNIIFFKFDEGFGLEIFGF